ncbi:MAG: ATP-binding protein [Nitrospiraceae bacterium]|nr:ATP-binding protein [Nitrospiraceae bacterium]
MRHNLLPITLAVFVVSLIITLNIFLQQNYQAEMAEQFNKQQLLLASSISHNLENIFDHIGHDLVNFATLVGNGRLRGENLYRFANSMFEEAKKDIKVNVRYFGPDGNILYSSMDDAGPTPADRELIERTKGLGQGKLITSEKGLSDRIIKVFTPVISNGRWAGALGVDIYLESLNDAYLAPIRSGKKGYAWMMSSDGTLLYHPTQPGMIGKNLYKASSECLGCHKSFDTELWILKSGQMGASSYIAPFGEDKLIAFSKMNILGKKWIVCASIPYSEVTTSIRKSLNLHSILILTIFGATAIGAVMMIIVNRKRIKAEEKAKHEEELEKYAAILEKTVSERTRELYTEKEKLNSIVNAIGGGLVLTDIEGKILWANNRFGDMAGCDVVGEPCMKIYPEGAVLSSQVSDTVETNVVEGLFDKKGRYFQVTTAPVKSDKEIIGFIRLVQDITEMKKIEEQMLHSEKLSSVGRLTAGIAHEIGNPLTAVFSFLQILRDMEKEDFKKESLDTVLFHINRIADIVRQLASLSKVTPPELKPVKVNLVLNQALSLMRYDKRARNIDLKEELEEIPDVVTDENQLSQVFINLILNAVDAMPEGGTIHVRSKALVGRIVVEVEDTGIGIPKENFARIFDPFFTTKEKGTGLGLSVSYGIMKRLGGDIQAESHEGSGTRFSVIIPLRRGNDAGQGSGN